MMDRETGTDDFHIDPGYSFVHRRGARITTLDRWRGIPLIAGRDELRNALSSPELFSSQHELPNGHSPFLGVMTPPTPIRAVPIELDPPAHTEFRHALMSFFHGAAVQARGPDILHYTEWCLDQFVESGACDLFHDFAKLVPAMTTMKLLGLPIEDARIIADGVHIMSEDRFALSPTWVVLVRGTSDAVRLRRQEPREDLISHLLTIRIGGKPLTEAEIFEVCFTMIVGGMSTTARLVLGALSYLGARRDDRARLIGEPELIPDAIEEFLRYYSPVPLLCRTATRDVTLDTVRIPQGTRVGMGYAAANRDPVVFDDPDTVRIDRRPKGHVALGHGAHYCIGGMLGRFEGRIMIEQVLKRLPDYAPDTTKHGSQSADSSASKKTARGLTWADRVSRGLPVTFTPSRSVHAHDEFWLRSLNDHHGQR